MCEPTVTIRCKQLCIRVLPFGMYLLSDVAIKLAPLGGSSRLACQHRNHRYNQQSRQDSSWTASLRECRNGTSAAGVACNRLRCSIPDALHPRRRQHRLLSRRLWQMPVPARHQPGVVSKDAPRSARTPARWVLGGRRVGRHVLRQPRPGSRPGSCGRALGRPAPTSLEELGLQYSEICDDVGEH